MRPKKKVNKSFDLKAENQKSFFVNELTKNLTLAAWEAEKNLSKSGIIGTLDALWRSDPAIREGIDGTLQLGLDRVDHSHAVGLGVGGSLECRVNDGVPEVGVVEELSVLR